MGDEEIVQAPRTGEAGTGARTALSASCQLLVRQGCEGAGGGP